jgi:serine/threonine-protein kinase
MTRGRAAQVARPIAAMAAVLAAIVCRARPPAVVASTIVLDPPVYLSGPPALALSPDGTRLAYLARVHGETVLCQRVLAQSASTCWDRQDAAAPFFSSDGEWIAYFGAGQLERVPSAGGSPVVVGTPGLGQSGFWGADGSIVVSTWNAVYRTPAHGAPERVAPGPGEVRYTSPAALSAEAFLVGITSPGGNLGSGVVVARSFATGKETRLVVGTQPHFDQTSGTLVYARDQHVLAITLNPRTLAVVRDPAEVASDVLVTFEAGAAMAMDARGTLVYAPASAAPVVRRTVMWVDRQGGATPMPIPANAFETPRVSPDGRRLAVAVRGVSTEIWTYDFDAPTGTPRTASPDGIDTPLWAPDGRSIQFAAPSWFGELTSARGANAAWPFRRASGEVAGPAVLSLSLDPAQSAPTVIWQSTSADSRQPIRLNSVTPDGRVLAGEQGDGLWLLDRPAASASARALSVQAPAGLHDPAVSPDGRWLAYSSSASGTDQVYVASYPSLDGAHQISTTTGTEPVWNRSGREIVYRSGLDLMAVDLQPGERFVSGAPHRLFRIPFRVDASPRRTFDLAPDGQHVVMLRREPPVEVRELRMVPFRDTKVRR